jgi:hypothetical protein
MQRIGMLAAAAAFLLFNPATGAAQGQLEVFSELGEVFTLYVNQMKQNEAPGPRVEVNDLAAGFYQVRIDFEDPSLADFAQNNVGIENGTRSTFIVKLNRKGDYVLRMNGYAPMANIPSTHSMPPPPPPATSTDMGTVNVQAGGNSQTETVSMNINMGNMLEAAAGALGNMNVNVTTTTTTTTSTSGNWGGGWEEEPIAPAAPSGPVAMSAMDFNDYLGAIRSKTFEDSKLSTAKAPLSSNYLTAKQIKQVMQVFTFEDSRLEFAIFAHSRCVDPGNYYQVYDAFEFELSIDDLQEAIGE